MVLITLAIAGAVLAHQKKEKRKEEAAARSLAQEVAARQQREDEAFAELQSYASFQTSLSSTVLDEVETESLRSARGSRFSCVNGNRETSFSGGERNSVGFSTGSGESGELPPRYSYAMREGGFSGEAQDTKRDYEPSFSSTLDLTTEDLPAEYGARPKAQLCSPVIIPQEADSAGNQSWGRAYAPALMGCGISPGSWLDFIDSFNAFLQTSSNLQAINIVSLYPSQFPGQTSTNDVSTKIFQAAEVSKSNARSQTNDFLNLANEALFIPNGLFAMVVIIRPDTSEQVLEVDFSHFPIHDSKLDAALSLLALNAGSDPASSTRSSYSSLKEDRTSIGNENIQLNQSSPLSSSQSCHFVQPLARPSSTSLQTLMISVSAANDRRKDSRRLKKRQNDVLGVGLGMALGNGSGGSVRVEKVRPGSVSSFSSGISTRMGAMALESESATGVRDSIKSTGSLRQLEFIEQNFQLRPGALYLVIVSDLNHA